MSTAACLAGLVERATNELKTADPSEWSATDAEAVLAESVRLANIANHTAAIAAQRIGETQAFRRTGDRTEAHCLARVAGVGLGAARTALEVTAATSTLPATAAALAGGELSMRQAAAICGAALVDRSAEARLLRMAKARGIGQLEEECDRIRATAAPGDETERHRRAHAERGAWTTQNRDGSAEIRFRSTTADVAEAWATLTAYRDRLFRDTTPEPGGERPTFDQLNADAFMDMARTAAGGNHNTACGTGAMIEPTLPLPGVAPSRPAPQPAKIIVRIDWDALVRGYPTCGETSEIAGLGPVPVPVVRDMITTGDPFLAAVVTKGVGVHTVAHLGRSPTAMQRTALEWLNPRCRVEGCDRTVGLEIDHRIDWTDTKVTLLDWLEWMCRHHHHLKTNEGWRLVPGTGIRPLVPPTDPRHPKRASPTT